MDMGDSCGVSWRGGDGGALATQRIARLCGLGFQGLFLGILAGGLGALFGIRYVIKLGSS